MEEQNSTFLNKIAAEAKTEAYRQFSEKAANHQHPTAEMLYDYASGELDEDIASTLRAHLAFCSECAREALSVMRSTDELEQVALEWANQPEPATAVPAEADIADTVSAAVHAVKSIGEHAMRWVSELWQPQWAGELLTAADVPEQSHTFASEHGDIHLTCHWQDASCNEPAMLYIKWQADMTDDERLWIRFVNPANHALWQKIFLGARAVGEERFIAQDLAFDFLHEQWAISLALEASPA